MLCLTKVKSSKGSSSTPVSLMGIMIKNQYTKASFQFISRKRKLYRQFYLQGCKYIQKKSVLFKIRNQQSKYYSTGVTLWMTVVQVPPNPLPAICNILHVIRSEDFIDSPKQNNFSLCLYNKLIYLQTYQHITLLPTKLRSPQNVFRIERNICSLQKGKP